MLLMINKCDCKYFVNYIVVYLRKKNSQWKKIDSNFVFTYRNDQI